MVARYRSRISGPLLDRIDMQVEVPALPSRDLAASAPGESSSRDRDRVARARQRQLRRPGMPNARLDGSGAEEAAHLDCEARSLLEEAAASLMLSARAHFRVLKVARTVADLEQRDAVSAHHLAEALRYRGTAPRAAPAGSRAVAPGSNGPT
jgi:magnesium chelatase family protein